VARAEHGDGFNIWFSFRVALFSCNRLATLYGRADLR